MREGLAIPNSLRVRRVFGNRELMSAKSLPFVGWALALINPKAQRQELSGLEAAG